MSVALLFSSSFIRSSKNTMSFVLLLHLYTFTLLSNQNVSCRYFRLHIILLTSNTHVSSAPLPPPLQKHFHYFKIHVHTHPRKHIERHCTAFRRSPPYTNLCDSTLFPASIFDALLPLGGGL